MVKTIGQSLRLQLETDEDLVNLMRKTRNSFFSCHEINEMFEFESIRFWVSISKSVTDNEKANLISRKSIQQINNHVIT
jgi:hypothetical protein